jgi:peptidoglycan/xylan/chitin deacetylase (PgdA/CDA1 family)
MVLQLIRPRADLSNDSTLANMSRIDRTATLYFGRPWVRIFGPHQRGCVPVLMYHSISENLFGKSHPYYQINTAPEIFARQMRWLRNNGYRTIDTNELWRGLEKREDLSKSVVITFDDGYRDFYTDAMEVMKQCGLSATIYLATDRIQDKSLRIDGVEYLTWNEVRELQREGIRFGSHTVTHPDLRSLGPEQIEYELCCSKETMEDQLGVSVDSFAYPFAFPEQDKIFTHFLEDVLTNCGFENGVSTILGRASLRKNRFFLPRIPVNTWDDQQFFQAKIEGGYDWLHWAQAFKKSFEKNRPLMQRVGRQEALR